MISLSWVSLSSIARSSVLFFDAGGKLAPASSSSLPSAICLSRASKAEKRLVVELLLVVVELVELVGGASIVSIVAVPVAVEVVVAVAVVWLAMVILAFLAIFCRLASVLLSPIILHSLLAYLVDL